MCRSQPTLSKQLGRLLLLTALLAVPMVLAARGDDAGASSAAFQERVLDDFVAGFRGQPLRLERAMKVCEAALARDPENAMAMAWLGCGLVFQCGEHFEGGDFQTGMRLWTDGLAKLDRAVALRPDDALVRLRRGETLLDVWQHDPMAGKQLAAKAAGDMDHALELDPHYLDGLDAQRRGEVLYKVGLALDKAGDTARAREYMNRVATAAAGSSAVADAKRWLADGTAAASSVPDAEPQQYERFDLLVRDDLFAAMLQGDRTRYKKAMDTCEDKLATDPKHAGAMSFHGWGLQIKSRWQAEAGDREEATRLWARGLEELNQAVSLEPDNVGPMLVRGSVFINSTRSEHLSPDQSSLMLALGTYDYERVYDMQKEQGYFKYLSEHARGGLLMGLADAWHRRGNMDRAKDYFKLVLEEVPKTDYATDAENILSGKTDWSTLTTRSCVGCHTK